MGFELHKQLIGWLTVYYLYVFRGEVSGDNEWLAKDLIANHYVKDGLKATSVVSGAVVESNWKNRYGL